MTSGEGLDALRVRTLAAGLITVYSSPSVFNVGASEVVSLPFIPSVVVGEASGLSWDNEIFDTKDSFRGGGRLGGNVSKMYRGLSSGVLGVLGALPRRARSGSPLGLS